MYNINYFVFYIGLFVNPCNLCKNFNNTCYNLFYSVSDTFIDHIVNISDYSDLTTTKQINKTGGCVEPGYLEQCSSHGQCINESCKCYSLRAIDNDTESIYEYSGLFCEECPYCRGQRCEKIQPCVECILRNRNCTNDCFMYYNIAEKLVKTSYNDKFCEVEDGLNCLIKFKYFYKDNDLLIDIEGNTQCLNGRKYVLSCCYIFLCYIFLLLLVSKYCLNGIYYVK